MAVEPTRTWLHIVPERQPEVLELPHFLAVLAMSQVDDVRNAQRLELLHVAPGGYCAAKRQPLACPKHPHAGTPLFVANLLKTNVLSPQNCPKMAIKNKALTGTPKMGF
jgi:hypothetical protein